MRKPARRRRLSAPIPSVSRVQRLTLDAPVPQQLAEDDLRPSTRRLRLNFSPSEQPLREQGVGDEVSDARARSDSLGESIHANDAALSVVLQEGGDERGLELLGGLSHESGGRAEVVLGELEESVGVVLNDYNI